MAFNEPMPLPWLSDSSTAILPALAVSTVPNATTLAGYRALAANYIYLIS
jgi:hypothetical protein